MSIIEKLSEPLYIKDIDFRVQSINKGGYVTILPYKDARVDINRLNSVCGIGWSRSHSRDNKNCTVSLWDADSKQWVSREDTGTESNTEQQKGLASDSFKRACFNWGIGIELYDYPIIELKLNGGGNNQKGCEWYLNENKKDRYGNASPAAGYNFKLKEWKWYAEFEGGKISFLACQDNSKKTRWSFGKRKVEIKKEAEK